jgi:hypothetical protein
VEVIPIGSAEELLVRQFSVTPALLSEKGLKPADDIKALFTRLGISFPEGATAAFASDDRIIVKAKEEDLDLIAAWLAQPAPSKSGSDESKTSPVPGTEANADAVAMIQRKLSAIIIPRLEFRDASIREAADFIRRKSVELDTAEPDPSKRGISIILKPGRANVDAGAAPPPKPAVAPIPAIPGLETIPDAPPAAAPDAFDARIHLSVANIPLGEALRYVASLGRMQYQVEPHAVVLSIAPPPGELITKEYKTLPAFAGMITRAKSVKDLLTAHSVTFPQGATVDWNALTQRLTIRNTPENHNRVADLLRQTSPSAPAAAVPERPR